MTLGKTPLIPTPLSELSAEFLQANGRPAGLWLPCDGPESKAYDLSGNDVRNTGSLNGVVVTPPGGWGVLGSSWSVDGATGAIPVGNGTDFQFTTSFSLRAVFWADSTKGSGSWQQICGKGSVFDTNNTFMLVFFNSTLFAEVYRSGFDNVSYANAKDQWIDAVMTYDNSYLRLYVNGQFIGSAFLTGPLTTSTATFTIGQGSRLTDDDKFGGKIATIQLWKSVLSDGQVSSLYHSLRTGEPYPLFARSSIPLDLIAASGAGGGVSPGWLAGASHTLQGGLAA